jgi:hypothetical protein
MNNKKPSQYTDLLAWKKTAPNSFTKEASLMGEEFIEWYDSLNSA